MTRVTILKLGLVPKSDWLLIKNAKDCTLIDQSQPLGTRGPTIILKVLSSPSLVTLPGYWPGQCSLTLSMPDGLPGLGQDRQHKCFRQTYTYLAGQLVPLLKLVRIDGSSEQRYRSYVAIGLFRCT